MNTPINCSKIEISEVYENFKNEQKRFDKNINKLIDIYSHLKNKDKIISLLNYWLFSIRCLHRIYGSSGLKKFCIDKNNSINGFSYQIEFNMYRDFDPKKNYVNNKSKVFIFYLILLATRFTNKIYLPGKKLTSLFNKINNFFSIFIFNSIYLEKDNNLEEKINIIIDNHFFDLTTDERFSIKSKLPIIFKAKKIIYPFRKKPLFIEGSAASFLNFNGNEKILALDHKLIVNGYQHGGGYGIFKDDYFAFFEKKLCDNFYGWGFSKNNVRQFKFKKTNIQSEFNISRILWIEEAYVPYFYISHEPRQFCHAYNNDIKKFIYDEMKRHDISYSNLVHPKFSSRAYDDLRKNNFNINANINSEDIIKKNDICIFDSIGSTLIHYCLENEITFLLVISIEDYKGLTKKAKVWFELLRENKLGFILEDDRKLFAPSVNYLIKNNDLPRIIKKFNQNNFLI